jgi:hypothetical protein
LITGSPDHGCSNTDPIDEHHRRLHNSDDHNNIDVDGARAAAHDDASMGCQSDIESEIDRTTAAANYAYQ